MLDELRSALELATEEELQQLTQILFCRKLNPLDYLQTPDILEVQSRDRQDWLDDIERRFRYLAADGIAVLKGQTQSLTYRDVLIRVCRYLKIPYSQQMTAIDLETEVFVRLVGRAWKRLPRSERKTLTVRVQRSLSRSNYSEPLPAQIQHNPIQILLKGSSILAVNSMKTRPHFLLFLTLTMFLSFATPIVFVGGGLAGLALLQHFPGLREIAQLSIDQILQILAVFGSGDPVTGMLAIGLTCGFVGGLFMLCTNYRYRHLLD